MYPFAFSLIFAYLRSVYFFRKAGFFVRRFLRFFQCFLGREAAQDEAQECDGWPNGTCLREARRYVLKGGREKGTCLREARTVHV